MFWLRNKKMNFQQELGFYTTKIALGSWYAHLKMNVYEQRHKISNNVVCATSKGSDQPAHTRSLIRACARRLYVL